MVRCGGMVHTILGHVSIGRSLAASDIQQSRLINFSSGSFHAFARPSA
jgi:ABC-type branched-subunit amino acid transport system substrate-binding protein